ncbi:uncharacterized protein [Pyrus communis]|uniref:uncharacterized protein n=1 Tax=Pyrus communis TaxID=23211 RepID=UPI0035C05248
METYTTWNHHGEQIQCASSSHITRQVETVESVVDPNKQIMDIINDAFSNASSNTNEEVKDDVPPTMDSEAFEKYEKLLKSAKQELYPGCERFSVLMVIVELMHGKIKFCMSNQCFDYFLGVFKRMFPKDNRMPKDHKSAKKVLSGTGLGKEKFMHVKIIAFYSTKRMKRWINALLKRFYMSMHTASDMRWHKDRRVDDNVMRHPADGYAWKEFHRLYPDFGREPQKNKTAFFNGIELHPRPREWFEDEIVAQVNRLDFALLEKSLNRTKPDIHLNWTHNTKLFERPYWSKLKLRHNIDVMHVEKNVFDTLVETILDIKGKTKDTIKAQIDLEKMGIRPGLWMTKDGDIARKKLASFSVKSNKRKVFAVSIFYTIFG